MEIDTNPYRSLAAHISPTDFEIFCMETLKAYAKREKLTKFKITHNQKVEVDDGTYQIDVLAEYFALGTKNIVVVECKKQSRSVEREIVALLYAKMQSIGAQKGIVISTTGFQRGATQYAEKHGIALWQVCNDTIKHFCDCAFISEQFQEFHKLRFIASQYLPDYLALEWDCSADCPYTQIYPTKTMLRSVLKKAKE